MKNTLKKIHNYFSAMAERGEDSVVAIKEWGLRGTISRLRISYLKHRFLLWRREKVDGFDEEFGTETNRKVRLTNYRTPKEKLQGSVMYWATPVSIFRKILESLNLKYEQYHFIDIGAGKGRVLLMASEFSFSRVTGIEIDSELAETAKRNIEAYSKSRSLKTSVDVCCKSVDRFSFSPVNTVIYLFNPFDAKVLNELLAELNVAFSAGECELIFIFLDPYEQHLKVLSSHTFLKKIAQFEPSSSSRNTGEFPWVVYQAKNLLCNEGTIYE